MTRGATTTSEDISHVTGDAERYCLSKYKMFRGIVTDLSRIQLYHRSSRRVISLPSMVYAKSARNLQHSSECLQKLDTKET